MTARLSATEFAAFEGIDDWRYLLGRVEATFRAGSASEAAAFARAAVDEMAARPPDVNLRGPVVHLTVPDREPLVADDVALVRRLSALAAEHGLISTPSTALRSEIAIDALDIAAVLPFWRAAFGYVDAPTAVGEQVDAVVDPLRIGPAIWFQQMDAVRPERNHIHLDVTVPHDIAEQRVADVLAAGGRHLYSESQSFHVLADPEDNEVCICTWLDRDARPAD